MMTKILQKESLNIRCPHCKKEIKDAWLCQIESVIGMRYAHMCSNCQKLLGISLQKESSVLFSPKGEKLKTQIPSE